MFITKAFAADAPAAATPPMPEAPSLMAGFMSNMIIVLVLVVLFYVLLIMPQQKRFKAHSAMLAKLQKGDRVVTGGGLVGTIDKLVNDQEVVVDLGNGVKVTALRSTLQTQGPAPHLKSK